MAFFPSILAPFFRFYFKIKPTKKGIWQLTDASWKDRIDDAINYLTGQVREKTKTISYTHTLSIYKPIYYLYVPSLFYTWKKLKWQMADAYPR